MARFNRHINELHEALYVLMENDKRGFLPRRLASHLHTGLQQALKKGYASHPPGDSQRWDITDKGRVAYRGMGAYDGPRRFTMLR